MNPIALPLVIIITPASIFTGLILSIHAGACRDSLRREQRIAPSLRIYEKNFRHGHTQTALTLISAIWIVAGLLVLGVLL